MGWESESERHALAARGVKTKSVNKLKDAKIINMHPNDISNIPEYVEMFGLNPDKSRVHGTSLENAKQIKKDGWIREGTFVSPYFGGLLDTYNWSFNSYTDPVIIMVELETNKKLGLDWIHIGKRAEFKDARNVSEPLKIKKMLVFKVPSKPKFKNFEEEHEYFKTHEWYQTIKEIKI